MRNLFRSKLTIKHLHNKRSAMQINQPAHIFKNHTLLRMVSKLVLPALILFACNNSPKGMSLQRMDSSGHAPAAVVDSLPLPDTFALKIAKTALGLTEDRVTYDPAYTAIPYPNGDVPADRGVCSDVVIRTYRRLGIDLQKEVHEDMKANFSAYPKKWGLKKTDTNIDHRRVPNLQVFFARHGQEKQISSKGRDYRPGDIVTWDLGEGLTHIGIVVHKKSTDQQRYLIVHNIGRGQELSDCLFEYKITGHYAYKK